VGSLNEIWFQNPSSAKGEMRFPLTVGFTVYKFSQLAASTNNFSSYNIIGRGGYANVYKGILPNGVVIAIKTCSGEHISK